MCLAELTLMFYIQYILCIFGKKIYIFRSYLFHVILVLKLSIFNIYYIFFIYQYWFTECNNRDLCRKVCFKWCLRRMSCYLRSSALVLCNFNSDFKGQYWYSWQTSYKTIHVWSASLKYCIYMCCVNDVKTTM